MSTLTRIANAAALTALTLAVSLAMSVPTPATASPTTETPADQCRTILAQPNGVLFIGDSITEMGFASITAQFAAAGKHVCVNGRGGRYTADGVAQLASYVEAGVLRPDTQIVMALGTNDVLRPYGYMRGQIEAAMRLAGSRRVFWVKVYQATILWGPATRARCLAGSVVTDLQITEASRAHANLRSVDWWGLVVLTRGKLMDPLGVHPTWAGNYYRTVLVLQAMR